MSLTKRNFLKAGAALGVGAGLAACSEGSKGAAVADEAPAKLENMTGNVVPISIEERRGRIAKAQRLMGEQGIDAIVIEPGAAMTYFSGVQWWRSERTVALVVPKEGDVAMVAPYFEEPSILESLTIGDDVRTWHEHENPFDVIKTVLDDRGAGTGTIGLEESVRYFIADGLAKSAPQATIVNGAGITRGCRMFKSPAEIALMQVAADVVMAAYRHIATRFELGMSNTEVSTMMRSAISDLGGRPTFASVLTGEASAYPHGTNAAQIVEENGVILMDCGCSIEGYQADISRTFVFGEPTQKQRDVWDTCKRGQEIAMETATLGLPAGKVDDAVRAYYTSLGYGPDYQTPGLSHRLGHGIGMEGHEPVNFVRGETTPLQPGMCFSNEPGIYIFGEFGVRLEDCLYMTEDGPKLFSEFSHTIEDPMGLKA
ncbi:MAG: Xaa-Pro peptidase family protein [Pseudomonadota bacterium]